VDRLDDAPMQPNATQAQPEPFDDDATLQEMQELLEKSGEPHFRELEPTGRLAAPDGGPAVRLVNRPLAVAGAQSRLAESTGPLETF
jgi:hypothetical protein